MNAFALPGAFFGGEYRFFILVDMMHQTDEAVLIGLIIDRVEPRQTYALGSVMVQCLVSLLAVCSTQRFITGALTPASRCYGTPS